MIQIYRKRGFIVSNILTDHEFQPLTTRLLITGAELNATSANEHDPEIARVIQVIKERAQPFIVMVPFKAIPILMKKHLIINLVQIINLNVHKNSVSPFLGPAAIVLGHQLDIKLYCQLPFGSFCQVIDEPKPLNSTSKPRTLDGIALRPVWNSQGGYYSIHIDTWSLLRRRSWTQVPMPGAVIGHIDHIAMCDEQPHCPVSFVFKRHNNSVIISFAVDEYHLLTDPAVDEGATDNDVNDADPGAAFDMDELHHEHDVFEPATEEDHHSDNSSVTDSDSDESTSNGDEIDDVNPIDDNETSNEHSESNDAHDNNTIIEEKDASSNISTRDDNGNFSVGSNGSEDEAPREPVGLLQQVIQDATKPPSPPQTQRDSSAKNDILPDINEDNIIDHEPDQRPRTRRYYMRARVTPKTPAVFSSRYGFTFQQMSAREGLQRFGERAANVLIAEWIQVDHLNLFEGVYFSKLSKLQRQRTLCLVQLIKLKGVWQSERTCLFRRSKTEKLYF